MAEMAYMAELKGVTKTFGGVAAVTSASFVLGKGEVVGFVGANGAGKTTTISMMMGFLAATSGSIKLFGAEITPENAHRSHQKVGYVAGDMELPAQLTGKQYIDFLLHQAGGDHSQTYEMLIDRFAPQLDKKIHTLSRGNKQKIALVAAFVTDPELVVLDEPTSGLDPHMQETFIELVREFAQLGTTVFMSSHYLQEVAEVCDRVILMKDGEIVQDISTKELLSSSGKRVVVRTSYKATRPPKHATEVVMSEDANVYELSFIYRGNISALQTWVASVKQLQDIQISEFDLETVFKDLYETEGEAA